MLYDAVHGIFVLNYFPGSAYVWLLLWTLGWLALVVLGFTRNPCTARFPVSLRLASVCALTYWLFWLVIPLMGYISFFAWGFVDAVIAQGASTAAGDIQLPAEDEASAEAEAGAEGGQEGGAATAAALPAGLAAARSLERPFAAAIYLGLACWLAGNMAAVYQSMRHYWRIRTDPTYRQARFAAANMTDTGFVGRPFPWSSGNAPPAAQTDSDAPAPPGGTPSEPASQPTHAPPTSAAQARASSAVAAGRPAMHEGDTSTAPDVPNPDPRPVAPDTRGRLAPLDPRDRPALPPRPAAAVSSAMASLTSGSRYASAVQGVAASAAAAVPFMVVPPRNACQHASASRSGAADLV